MADIREKSEEIKKWKKLTMLSENDKTCENKAVERQRWMIGESFIRRSWL
jgi:hypothetical protein